MPEVRSEALDDMNTLVSYFLSLLGGGAIYKIISAVNESRKYHAETRKAGVESKAIEAKINPEVTDLSIATMERVHRQLNDDYNRIVAERDALQAKFDAMKSLFDEMQVQLASANDTINDLQERLRHLIDSLPEEQR